MATVVVAVFHALNQCYAQPFWKNMTLPKLIKWQSKWSEESVQLTGRQRCQDKKNWSQ